ncbi:hypothetical protein [Peptoniphilus harei]|uniref:hypothetical protein n=1 Tax=Peptoniphilus harei TaxID=54005 RepID=UPI002582B38C|nr:hypothetical protein [Peptoniphilus harei]MDU6743725.1 hypothetical protein [Peptoniphilus harei]
MYKYLEIIVYFTALFGYFLAEYTKIIKNEKIRKRVNITCHVIAWLMVLYELYLKKFL